MSARRCGLVAGLLAAAFATQAAEGAGTLVERGAKWSTIIVDNAQGSVTAAGVLDLSGDSIRSVENVSDLVVALRGLESGGGKGTLALSITPARSALAPMNLRTYATIGIEGLFWRTVGSTALGYAQGDKTIEGIKYERRAVSIDTMVYLNRESDPQIALIDDYASGRCSPLQSALPVAAPPVGAGTADTVGAKVPALADAATAKAVNDRAKACRDAVTARLGWNRSRVSLAFAAGRIQAADKSTPERSLGRTLVVTGTLGIGDGAALTALHRRTRDEPVLKTLTASAPQTKDGSLSMLRLQFGSNTLRGLLEKSNAGTTDVTASQRTYRHAGGVDIKLAPSMWLNLRAGRLASIAGGKTETGSSVLISYSPTAILDGP